FLSVGSSNCTFRIWLPRMPNILVKRCAPGRIRTADHLVRSQVLYPAELRAHHGKFSRKCASALLLMRPRQWIDQQHSQSPIRGLRIVLPNLDIGVGALMAAVSEFAHAI